jgi:hypothetical protein
MSKSFSQSINPQPDSSLSESSPSSPNPPPMHHPATHCYNTDRNFTPSSSSTNCSGVVAPGLSTLKSSATTSPDPAPSHLESLPPVARAILALRKNFPPLSEQQLNAIEILVLGHSDSYVANKIKSHRTTITRWRLYNPYFRAALSRRRHEIWGASADRFRKTITQALSVLIHQMKSEDPKTSHRAARTILSLAASKKLNPPDDPQDPATILHQIAREKKIESHHHDDPHLAPLDEDDFLHAMQHLNELERNFPLSPDSPPLGFREPCRTAV